MSEMNGYLTLFFLSFGSILVSCSRFPHRRYDYINTEMTWHDAQQYCRQKHSDLATFESMEEVQQLQPTFSYSWAWIGLIDDPSSWRGVMGKEPNSWRWSATGDHSQSGYQNWTSGQPDYWDLTETCAMMTVYGTWNDKGCDQELGFLCFTENPQGPVSYHYTSTLSTWSQAQAYCRQHHTDLAVIESSTQNTDVLNSLTNECWIGLYRVPWTWSDNSTSSFRNWDVNSPSFPSYEHCVAESTDHVWDNDICTKLYPPICQTISKLQSSVRVILKTGADVTLPVNNAQILQKVEAELRRRGWTDFRLTWRIKPVKQIPEQVQHRPKCNNF
ncbi:hypothetical protein NL108_018674 [Boleophthalmus pectinirostris]|nr:hypothetical protein NL108_018674 [Boleophthalmus pectinirostris]